MSGQATAPAHYDLNQLVRENLGYKNKTYTYEYSNGNIKYKHEYAYTTGTLPAAPNKTTQYHYEDSSWGDVLTKITETSYSGRSSSSAYSLNEITDESNTLAQTILGNNYTEVDLTENAIVDVGDAYSTNSGRSTYSSYTETRYTIRSDEIGNITNVSGVDFNWNGRRLESISQDGTTLVSYDYNMDGQRVSKSVLDTDTGEYITTEYFYNGSILAGQKKGNDTIVFMYDNNGDIFGFTYNGTPYYYVKNAQNDVYLIVDETGVAQVLYQYDAWGKVTACYDITEENIATINPITYRSYYMDIELGLFMYYLNSRYYMADWGRFISADSYVQTGQGMLDKNMFAYCGNNPVNMVDSSGTFGIPQIAIAILAGTLLVATVLVVKARKNNVDSISKAINNSVNILNNHNKKGQQNKQAQYAYTEDVVNIGTNKQNYTPKPYRNNKGVISDKNQLSEQEYIEHCRIVYENMLLFCPDTITPNDTWETLVESGNSTKLCDEMLLWDEGAYNSFIYNHTYIQTAEGLKEVYF